MNGRVGGSLEAHRLGNPRRLGQTDIELSPIGLGCWQFSQGKGFTGSVWAVLDQPQIDAVVRSALHGGITWFDTAAAYGNGQSERALSTALRRCAVWPGEVVVATKWLPILRTAANISKTVDLRLDCLQGYPIDLHQVHLPWSVSSIAAQMREMAKLVREGKIRSVGVSNFSALQMKGAHAALAAEGLSLASNQILINLLDRRSERNGVVQTARELGVTLIAYSPLAQGVLTGRFHDDPHAVAALPRGRRSRLVPASRSHSPAALARSAPLIEGLRAIGAAYGATAAQVALAWLLGYYGDTVVAIPGASRPEQAAENAKAMQLELTQAELAHIDALSRAAARS
jgi:aryl-alcohol dehydrogenase-like predicted oxidoreductase